MKYIGCRIKLGMHKDDPWFLKWTTAKKVLRIDRKNTMRKL